MVSEEQLHMYFDKELPEAQMREVEEALRTSPDLREKLESLKQLSQALQAQLTDLSAENVVRPIWGNVASRLTRLTWRERLEQWAQAQQLTIPRLAGAFAVTAFIVATPFIIRGITENNACEVLSLASDRSTVMVFKTEGKKTTVIWAFEEKETGTQRMGGADEKIRV